MKLKTSFLLALSLGTALQAHGANKVLLAEKINCGGYVSLEKGTDEILSLKVQIAADTKCASPINIQIPSQDISGSLKQAETVLPLQPRVIGTVLPIEIAGQTIMMDLSNNQIQQEVKTSFSREELEQAKQEREIMNERIARQEAEQNASQRRKNAAGAAAVGGAVVVGAGAVAAAAAAQSER